ncbi:MAG: hypothetical protein HY403_04420 [Elusimicrobia bacterium]|nr:hypothetical protein [Elusimicrobiota bacterium]
MNRMAMALVLSIAAPTISVNASADNLSSVNKSAVTQFIDIVLKNGTDSNISSILAPIIGLAKTMPMKKKEVVMSEQDNGFEKRACYVIYENADQHAVCAYFVKIKRSGLDKQTHYFRIDLNGNLEKAVLSQSKFDEAGKVIRGSGVKFDQDINSPEVRKTFEAEMNFWLKDWLPKERRAAAKKAA